jgi:hypothetical protein
MSLNTGSDTEGAVDSRKLVEALKEAGVDHRLYYVPGNPAEGPMNEQYMVLEHEGDRWLVGSWERGSFSENRAFDSEDDACRYFYEVLTLPETESYRMSPEEAEESRKFNERRQAEQKKEWAELQARHDAEQAAKGGFL